MLASVLIPELQTRFPDRGLRITSKPDPCVVFPAIHPDVGNIEIYDDGDELTILLGKFTHIHCSNYEDELSKAEKEAKIVRGAVDFLYSLFTDQVVMCGSHAGGGGCYTLGEGEAPWAEGELQYLWSEPRT